MIVIIKTPVSQDSNTFEFRVANIIEGLFDSSVPYDKKVQNLKYIKRCVICDSMEEAELVVSGIKLIESTATVFKIRFPEPFDVLIKIKGDKAKDFANYKDNLNEMFGNIFGSNIFK